MIDNILKKVGLDGNDVTYYGQQKAKIKWDKVKDLQTKENIGELILVTSINPTTAGEGKTTVAIGLSDYLSKIKSTILCLREPSLGPVFGQKGGATGGGFNKVIPSDDINLHFNGDFHAMTCANNLIASLIHHAITNKEIDIDPKCLVFNRALDINDRALRNILYGLGPSSNGVVGSDSFTITAASEIMSIMTMSTSYKELKQRIDDIVFAIDKNRFYTIKELGITQAVASLLVDALMPNIVQTQRNTPAFVHCGPFANISVGTNSVLSTQMALKLAKYTIVECGFGSDLGAEKYFNIIGKKFNLMPSKVVMVATVKALKLNGGQKNYSSEDVSALIKGFDNLKRHLQIIESFGIKPVIAINRFDQDTDSEINKLIELIGKDYELSVVMPSKENDNGFDSLASTVDKSHSYKDFNQTYEDFEPIEDKIEKICKNIYKAKDVSYVKGVKTKIKKIEDVYKNLKICISKTQYSLSDNKNLLCSPTDFEVTITDVKLLASVGILVVFLGDMNPMPGYSLRPLAKDFIFDDDGNITIPK